MNPLKLNTTSVSLAVTPTVVSTLFSHYLNRNPLKQKPTAHLSYDEGLHLVRTFLEFASYHTVEELQAFTAQWVPHPQWVKVEDADIPENQIVRSAGLIEAQLGPAGVRAVGGRRWWQWRRPHSPLKAEWIEMRSDYHERKKLAGGATKRVMLYVHGGAYFFGSVDEHRYQMQRHARKLKARVFAPRYRLSPQFPFPCGLQDCLAAYLYLLTMQDPSTIVLAGDSAGGGMVLSMMCVLRDQGIPLPAGAVLISPWVDLTHSFPSVSGNNPFDYIPSSGFHHKPSRAWPPPNEDDMAMMKEQAIKARAGKEKSATKLNTLEKKQAAPITLTPTAADGVAVNGLSGDNVEATEDNSTYKTALQLSVTIDGKLTVVKDQIQMYTTNALLSHPMVSPVLQPTLGGLPPLLIMVGGGEVLRDEQIYLAHKCANPEKYAPPGLDEAGLAQLKRYKPTDVQLQVWDDLCHVAPTLSFTRPAKYMYRAVAQFGAWALARAQQTEIEILDDDEISVISSSDDDAPQLGSNESLPQQVGKAGMPLPPFKKHMIRQRITRHGVVHELAPESELPGCTMKQEEVGVVTPTPVRRWLETKAVFDKKFSNAKAKVHKTIIKDMASGYVDFGDGEQPPPSALAGRRKAADELMDRKRRKSIGLALWSLWGSKHDEMTMQREKKAGTDAAKTSMATESSGEGSRSLRDVDEQDPPPMMRRGSKTKIVVDEHQTSDSQLADSQATAAKDTPVAALIEKRKEQERKGSGADGLSPDYSPGTGVAGKRPFIDGIALPFSLGKKDAETASMMTLMSGGDSRPISPMPIVHRDNEDAEEVRDSQATEVGTELSPETELKRPQLDNFVTAQEDLPLFKGKGKEVADPGVEQTA
ncbi:AB hydrolase superfamily protein [Colletotrichum trifolii]|uniref:AB hydrolase superfamily protein n=1 Tax=Colletotrichum trifolii TaxID=5466 RepID=A0A4R8QXY8_COLTR|nr:AB hydrolase superfamily protein [Colletotrichum trifolii]